MNNHYLLLITFFLAGISQFFTSNIHASVPIQTSILKDKIKAVGNIKTEITTKKIQADVNARALKEQRANLQQQIRSARQELKRNSVDLKGTAKKALDELDGAVKKLKESPKLTNEAQDYELLSREAATEAASLRQVTETLDTIELPKDISD